MSHASRARRLSQTLLGWLGAFALLALGFMALVVHEAVLETDQAALAWQRDLVRHGIDEQIVRVARDQESVTFWDEAVLAAEARDIRWLHENLGDWMFDYFGHDRTFVLTPSNGLLYAMRDGMADSSPDNVAALEVLAPQLAALRARLDERGDDVIAEWALHLVDGRPAIVSLMPILPHTERTVVPRGREHVFVSVQTLDGTFLAKVRHDYQLRGARIAPPDAGTDEETGLPIVGPDGVPIAALLWDPLLPGRRILAATLPMATVTAVVLLTLVGLSARHLYRSSAALEASEAYALHLAYRDTLTGLPNRAQLMLHLQRVLDQGPAEPMALLLVDLDRFKDVNDTYGHQAGDEVIREFASRVTQHLQPDDVLARLGGDEFAVVLRHLRSVDDVDTFAADVLASARAPFEVTGGKATIGVSIGCAFPEPGLDRSELLRRADIALYAAKRGGRDAWCHFAPEMDDEVQARHAIEEELRAALDAGGAGLLVHYQPLVDMRTGTIRGVEALVRWDHPRLGRIGPAAFVPVAEQAGLVRRLDEWVLQIACRTVRPWSGLKLAVNVSPKSFAKSGLGQRILAIARQENLAPARLEVEVTESVLLDDHGRAVAELRALRASGVRIALDDFGMGYSSFGRLRTLQVDRVKVDRSFVRHLGHAADATAIVDAVIELGHALGLEVTAEGVETEPQRAYLRAAGCDQMQGHLFAKPLDAAAFERLWSPVRANATA